MGRQWRGLFKRNDALGIDPHKLYPMHRVLDRTRKTKASLKGEDARMCSVCDCFYCYRYNLAGTSSTFTHTWPIPAPPRLTKHHTLSLEPSALGHMKDKPPRPPDHIGVHKHTPCGTAPGPIHSTGDTGSFQVERCHTMLDMAKFRRTSWREPECITGVKIHPNTV